MIEFFKENFKIISEHAKFDVLQTTTLSNEQKVKISLTSHL